MKPSIRKTSSTAFTQDLLISRVNLYADPDLLNRCNTGVTKMCLRQAGSGSHEGGTGKGMSGLINRARQKLKRWQNRTPAQQEANKAAQKRYRERKKGHVNQLQAQADALAAQACPSTSFSSFPDELPIPSNLQISWDPATMVNACLGIAPDFHGCYLCFGPLHKGRLKCHAVCIGLQGAGLLLRA